MTHIEVVREALDMACNVGRGVSWGSMEEAEAEALAALDSLEAELAQAREVAEANRDTAARAIRERDEARAALRRIAEMDYRGNEPIEVSIARGALSKEAE